MSALTISTRCRSEIDRVRTLTRGSIGMPSRSAALATCASRRRGARARPPTARATFSATVKAGTRRRSWNTIARPAARAALGEGMVASCPSRRIRPASGWCTPYSSLVSVLLPALFSPSSACTSPVMTEKSTPALAVMAPNRFVKPRACTTGEGARAVCSGGGEVDVGAGILRISRGRARPCVARPPRRVVGRCPSIRVGGSATAPPLS